MARIPWGLDSFLGLRTRWLARLQGASPAVRAKATVFMNVNAVVVAMLALNVVVVEWQLTHDHLSVVVESLWIGVIGAAFVLVRKGRYRAASNLTIVGALASLAILGWEDSFGGPLLTYTKLAFLMTPAIVYAFLLAEGAGPALWATVACLGVLAAFFFGHLRLQQPAGLSGGDWAWFVSTCLVVVATGYMARAASTIYLDAIDVAERAGARFRTIFDSLNDVVLILDPATGAILDANQKTVELYGWTSAQMARKTLSDLSSNVPPFTQVEAQGWIAKARAGEASTFEWQARTSDGRLLWVEISMRRGEIDGEERLLVSVRNIEARKKAERDRAGLEARLRQAEKMDAIGHLAGGVAHDFNNQLTGIMGYAELLASAIEDPELATFAGHIARASRRSADLTRQLLAFARRGNYQVVAVDVHALVGEVVALLERSLDKRITIRRDLAASSAVVTGDPTQLQNALLNLGINARDAMPDGGELSIKTSVVNAGASGSERLLRIVVADTGTGMSEETLKHLFEPFFTTKEPGKGTGMGLASVYGAVQIHKGTISVESALGRGTTFEIDLPLAGQEGGGRAAPGPRRVSLTGKRALVVDDERDVRDVIQAVLSRAGCLVEACADGPDAIALFARRWHEIDVVVLDMVMPKMSGRGVFAELRRIDPAVRVVLLSGHSLDGDTQALLEEGAAAFIQKPFQIDHLLEQIEACV
jgi:PAS domain S-box-containing protein